MAADVDTLQRVTVLGLGGMGAGMARCLLASGYDLTVWNRSPEKAADLAEAGARTSGSAADAVAAADVVLLSLADEDAVDDVLFGTVCRAARPGVLVVDTSTVSPAYARVAATKAVNAGVRRVEACVIGNPFQAQAGQLRVLTAGPAPHVTAARPLLETLGSQVVHLGPAGMAATMKLAFNLLLGAQLASLAEAVAYGSRAGLDREMLLAAIADSGFSSRVMAFRAGLMQEGRYTPPAFRSRLMAKDLRLVLAEATDAGVCLPVTERAAELFAALVERGDGDLDAAAICELPG